MTCVQGIVDDYTICQNLRLILSLFTISTFKCSAIQLAPTRIICYNHDMKTKTTLGWILVALGTLFLIGGLFVLIFTTVTVNDDSTANVPSIPPPFWEAFANRVMEFTIQLLEVDWTPIRVGVFLIVIGLVLEGSGAYVLISKP